MDGAGQPSHGAAVRVVDADREAWFAPATALLRLAVPPSCRGLTPYDSDGFARYLAAGCQPPSAHRSLVLRAAVVGGVLAGVADWRVLGADLFLNGLAVAPEHRRAGLGSVLLADGVELARRLGATAVELDVAVGNTAAETLYARAGFRPVGRSTWWDVSSAPIEPPWPHEGWRVRDWPAFVAHHEAYGFGDVRLTVPAAGVGSAGAGVAGAAARGDEGGAVEVALRALPGGWRLTLPPDATPPPRGTGARLAALAAALADRLGGGPPPRTFTVGAEPPPDLGRTEPIASFARLRRVV